MTNEASSADSRPKRKALGQGLNALLGARPTVTAPAAALPAVQPAGGLRRIPVDAIRPNPEQPRKKFTEQSLQELADSIRAHGVLQPIIVSPVKGSADRYELVAGERRWRAAQLAGLHLIPALVKEAYKDESLQLALIENLQREDLNPIEAAAAFDRLAGEFGLKHEEIAQRTGKDRATITNFLRLLKLPAEVQQLLSDGKISTGHAKALLAVSSVQEQRRLAAKVVAKDLSVRAIERLVSQFAGDGASKSKQAKQKQLDANIRAAVQDLERVLGTRVRLEGSGKKGKIVIEYYSPDDLMRIYDAIVKT
jgi:ParB family chromosome partitioning protein